MIEFACRVCRSPLQVEDALSGKVVRCPTCLGTMRVPDRAPVAETVPPLPPMPGSPDAPGPVPVNDPSATLPRPPLRGGTGRRYGFNCPFCSSRLEANEAMAAQDGTCPTCGNSIVIPILDRFGRLIDPRTQQVLKQDPHPVHAYAAAGERAPRILRRPDGRQVIQCPRCGGHSPVHANNCGSCGMPFTMEGTSIEASGQGNGFAATSLVLGIIGIPASCTVLVPILAIIFATIALVQAHQHGERGSNRGLAIAGLVFGCIGLIIAITLYG